MQHVLLLTNCPGVSSPSACSDSKKGGGHRLNMVLLLTRLLIFFTSFSQDSKKKKKFRFPMGNTLGLQNSWRDGQCVWEQHLGSCTCSSWGHSTLGRFPPGKKLSLGQQVTWLIIAFPLLLPFLLPWWQFKGEEGVWT